MNLKVVAKTVGLAIVGGIYLSAAIEATGFFFGRGLRSGQKSADLEEKLRTRQRKRRRIKKLVKELNKLKGKTQDAKKQWTGKDNERLFNCYKEYVDILGPNHPDVVELNELIMGSKVEKDKGEEVTEE